MNKVSHQRISFQGSQERKLAGVLHLPVRPKRGALILCHCFTCSKDYKILVRLARHLAEAGLATMRFDFSGLGQSEGDFSQTTLSSNVVDLLAAHQWMSEQGHQVNAFLGHSMGGAAAILAAAKEPAVKYVITLASSSSMRRIENLLTPDDWTAIQTTGKARIQIGQRPFSIGRELIEDMKHHSLLDTVREWQKHLLIIHGTKDETVNIKEGEKLFSEARQPKAFFAVVDGDHLFSQPEFAHEIAGAVQLWLNGRR